MKWVKRAWKVRWRWLIREGTSSSKWSLSQLLDGPIRLRVRAWVRVRVRAPLALNGV